VDVCYHNPQVPEFLAGQIAIVKKRWPIKDYIITGLCTILRVFSRNGLSM